MPEYRAVRKAHSLLEICKTPALAAEVTIAYHPIKLDVQGFAPLELVGAWVVDAADPRFGGISSLACDGDALLVLTDSGALIRFPRPGSGTTRGAIRELPAGPGSPLLKEDRDSEALARDPAGRGWWVSFENHNELWLYDDDFTRALTHVDVRDPLFYHNFGVEALASTSVGLVILPESGQSASILSNNQTRRLPFANAYGTLSEAATLPDGSILLLARRVGRRDILKHGGIDNRLLRLVAQDGRLETRLLAGLRLGPLHNVEAMAAEPAANGRTRLWLMTDNDFAGWRSTLLLELELEPPSR